jgi:hypothetical protein
MRGDMLFAAENCIACPLPVSRRECLVGWVGQTGTYAALWLLCPTVCDP